MAENSDFCHRNLETCQFPSLIIHINATQINSEFSGYSLFTSHSMQNVLPASKSSFSINTERFL